jgi:EAL domain-containing protein (putative c-di-GMP-specific phosphodiesterase class I)
MIAQADVGMLDGLERALINGRLRMVYQPKISLSDGRLRRVEALVRWDDPELGTIPLPASSPWPKSMASSTR